RNGQFGKINGGYGPNDKYQVGGNANLFDGNRRIALIAQSNNINQQNFATEDLLGVVGTESRRGRGGFRGGRNGGGGGRGGRGRGGNTASVNDFLVAQQSGITQTHATGINYNDKWGKQFDFNGSYFFNDADQEAFELLNRVYFAEEGTGEVYTEENLSQSQNVNHRLNLRMTYQIDSANSIILRPRLSVQTNQGESNTFGQTQLAERLLNQTNNHYRPDLEGWDFNNRLLFRHRFKKRGRTFSVRLTTSYEQKEGNSLLTSTDQFFIDNETADSLNQRAQLQSSAWALSSSIQYTEPLGRHSSLLINYRNSWRTDDSDQQTNDFASTTQDYTSFNESLSNVFTNDYHTQEIGVGYNYRKRRRMVFVFRTNFQWAQLDNLTLFPESEALNRRFTNLLPFLMLRFNFSRQENLRLVYRSQTQSPSVEQLQDVVNNNNPLQLSVGNPELDQSYTHRLFLRYSKTRADKANVYYLLLSATYTQNYIGNRIFLSENDHPIFTQLKLDPGAQLTLPVNLDGYWQLRAYFTYGWPVKAIKSNLNLDLTGNYVRTPGILDDTNNVSQNKTLSVGISLSSNISDQVDFTLSTRSHFNQTNYTLNSAQDEQYLNQASKFRIGWILPAGFVFRSQIQHQWYTGLSDAFNDNYLLWTLGIGKKIFNNQRGELTFSVVDLLRQNTNLQRNITESYFEDVRNQVLQRYALLSFTYHFR
ncbi:MAG: outer membrane beta-barrel protein, partial [Bacteroidota bacterium]